MKRSLLFIALLSIVFIIGSLAVSAAPVIIGPTSVTVESGEENNILNLILQNNETTPLNNIVVTLVGFDFEDDDGDRVNPFVTLNANSLGSQASTNLTLRFDVENGFDAQRLEGTLRVQATGFDVNNSLRLDVQPLACQPNARTRDLRLDEIDQPDDGDDFEPGDEINVQFDINNDGSDDIDVRIEAILYNPDNGRVEDSFKDTENINENDEQTVEFKLEIDTDIDEDLELYIKVFDDDDDLQCDSQKVDINIDKPDHKITVEDYSLSPTTVMCGERVSGSALLTNVGREDEFVTFEVEATSLNLRTTSERFELENGNNDDSERQVSVAFNIPYDARAGNHNVLLKAKYEGRETSIPVQLTVTECRSQAGSTGNTSTGTTTQPIQGNANTQPPVTGAATYTQKDVFDIFNSSDGIPTGFWIALDVIIAVLVLGLIIWLFSRRRN